MTLVSRVIGLASLMSFVAIAGCNGATDGEKSLVLRQPQDGEGNPHVLGGGRDDGDPAVVAVLTSVGACSGTLIAPRFVLTARHCVTDGRPVSVSWRSRAGSGPRTQARVHLPESPRGMSDDIAVLELAQPSTVTPIPANLSSRSLAGVSQIRMVGYGVTGTNNHDGGVKRSGTARASFTRNYVESHGTCYGDSGGPALAMIDGREQVIGVTSHGTSSRCEDGVSRFVRTDTHQAFLSRFIDSATPPPKEDVAVIPPVNPPPKQEPPPPILPKPPPANGVSISRGPDGSITITTPGGSVVVAANSALEGCDEDCRDEPPPRRRPRRDRHQ